MERIAFQTIKSFCQDLLHLLHHTLEKLTFRCSKIIKELRLKGEAAVVLGSCSATCYCVFLFKLKQQPQLQLSEVLVGWKTCFQGENVLVNSIKNESKNAWGMSKLSKKTMWTLIYVFFPVLSLSHLHRENLDNWRHTIVQSRQTQSRSSRCMPTPKHTRENCSHI